MTRAPRKPGDPRTTLAAELALGVLDAEARKAAEARAAADPAFAAEAAAWSARLHPLAEDVAPVAPPETLWTRIEAALPPQGAAAASPEAPVAATPPAHVEPAHRALLRRWRTLAAGMSVAAAACFAALVVTVGRPALAPPLLAARLAPPAETPLLTNEALYTATVDRAHGSAVLTPVNPGPTDPRVRELWLIPAGQKPISAGLLAKGRTISLKLSPAMVKQTAAGATLAVTLEREGGAPGGVAQGPIIATGVLSRI